MGKFQKGHTINKGRVPWNKIPKPEPIEIPLPPESEIIWAAGFWEGEGSIGKRYVNACQVDRWPLERLLKSFGGSLRQPKLDERYHSRPIWHWHLCGDRARLFVYLIYPHLSPRRQQQINSVFTTRELWIERQEQKKEVARIQSERRKRNEKGQYARVLGEKIKEPIWLQ